jgi:hypothetical protein
MNHGLNHVRTLQKSYDSTENNKLTAFFVGKPYIKGKSFSIKKIVKFVQLFSMKIVVMNRFCGPVVYTK